MFIRYLALTIFLAQVSNGQRCGDQWRSHEQCMKNHGSNDADLSPSDRANMKAKARLCFRDQGCRDPFLDDGDSQAKQRCYVEYKDHMRRDIERCVQQTYPDYDIPAENDAASQYGQDMIQLRNSDCRPQDKRLFVQCLLAARGQRHQNNHGPDDYCSLRYDCYQQARYTQACYDRAARVRDELCRCTRQAPIDTYKNVYVECLRSAGRPTPDDHQDYNLAALNAMANSGGDKKFCSNMSDPCGGFRGRQSNRDRGFGRSGQESGGGRWNEGAGNSRGGSSSGRESSGDRWNEGAGNGQGSSGSGQGWNSGDQGGGSSSIDTSSSNFGTSSGSNTDFGSLLSGGGIIPDPSSILGSSSSGVGNLGGILGSGFDPSQIFGGNFDLTSMLSNAGTGGGLLGGLTGGTGGGLLGGSGGGLPDLSSLFGGRRKK